MPFHQLEDIREEFVTPKHSTAFGRLISGEQVELGVLRYKAGEGAETHAHPHEQIILVLGGLLDFTLDGVTERLGPGQAVHIPPNVPHSVRMMEDSQLVSCKGIVGGVGHRI